MKHKTLLGFGLIAMTILGATSAPVFAQFQRRTNQSKQTIQSLPNGEYFYGTSPSPDSIGSWYVIFRKTGDSITGWQYYNKKEGNPCFRGTVNLNNITNITKADSIEVANRWEFSSGKPLDLGRLYKLNFKQADDKTIRRFQQCIQVFSNKR